LPTGIIASTLANGLPNAGKGGDIQIVTNSLKLSNGGFVAATTLGSGVGGKISIMSNHILISRDGGPYRTGIISDSLGTDPASAPGTSGDVNVQVADLQIADQGEISARSFGPAASGSVQIAAGNIALTSGGLISTSNAGDGRGGDVTIKTGGNVTLDSDSNISASSNSPVGGGDAGTVSVSAGGQLVLSNGGQIVSQTFGLGNGGIVTVNAADITVSGTSLEGNLSGIFANSNSSAEGGNAGDVNVSAKGKVLITGGGQVASETFGSGKGGDVNVAASNLEADGGITPTNLSGISADSYSFVPGGNAGNVTVNVSRSIVLNDGGTIEAVTYGPGGGGNVVVHCGTLTASGSFAGASPSGVDGTSYGYPVGGNAGDVSVLANTISINAGAEIASSTIGSGNGGKIYINASDIEVSGLGAAPISQALLQLIPSLQSYIDSVSPQLPTGIIASTLANGLPNAGKGGDIQIVAGNLTLTNGGGVAVTTLGSGVGGRISIMSNRILISRNGGRYRTGIISDSIGTDPGSASGTSGDLNVRVADLQITDQGEISARSFGPAASGSIQLEAGTVLLTAGGLISSSNSGTGRGGDVSVDSSGPISLSGSSSIAAAATTGDAGNVRIRDGADLTLDGGSSVSTSSVAQQAGLVQIETAGSLDLTGGSEITASAGTGGGNITLKVNGTFYLFSSSVMATAGTGAGGNITIDPIFIILNNGLISANAAAGAGGNILIQGQYFFDNESPITATGSTAGTVAIATLPLDLANALAGLQVNFVDISNALQERCSTLQGADASSFLVIGRGGVEDNPDEPRGKDPARRSDKKKDHKP
jgi:large exoprotein involved in heme utilization and adhesion